MSDLISRKAALTHIEKIRQSVQMMDDTHRASIIMNGMYLCEKAVMNQPSAEPEIIRCKDCKHWRNNSGDLKLRDNYCNEAMHGFYYRCSGDDFCSRAERRTDEK